MVDGQMIHPALALLAAQPQRLAREGNVAARWRGKGSRKMGPYFELRYREGGKIRSIYLGRDGPLVAETRRLLAALQEPRKDAEAHALARRRIKTSLRRHKAELNRYLQRVGLHMKGWELRGWKRFFGK
jgi:hypothetical protein